MESAGSHAYVSKNFIDAYLKKKQRKQAQTEEKLVPKQFKEDEQNKGRRRSREASLSDEDEGGERCRSVESLFEQELEGNLNLSDNEMDDVN